MSDISDTLEACLVLSAAQDHVMRPISGTAILSIQMSLLETRTKFVPGYFRRQGWSPRPRRPRDRSRRMFIERQRLYVESAQAHVKHQHELGEVIAFLSSLLRRRDD